MQENNSIAAVQAWLRAGAEVQSGLLLFSQFSSNTRFSTLVRMNPARYRTLLIDKLCAVVGIEKQHEQSSTPSRRFRDDFPFLRDVDCPVELKVLASDKITAHERYILAHDHLFDCTTLDECYQTARTAIDSFVENRAIFAELNHYREHRAILGKHRIFEHLQQLRKLRKLNIIALLTEERRLRQAIWRINDEIKKNTKQHLQTIREQRRQQKEELLNEVTNLIVAYNNAR